MLRGRPMLQTKKAPLRTLSVDAGHQLQDVAAGHAVVQEAAQRWVLADGTAFGGAFCCEGHDVHGVLRS